MIIFDLDYYKKKCDILFLKNDLKDNFVALNQSRELQIHWHVFFSLGSIGDATKSQIKRDCRWFWEKYWVPQIKDLYFYLFAIETKKK